MGMRFLLALLVLLVLGGLLVGRGCLGRIESELPERAVHVLSAPEILELLALEPHPASHGEPGTEATFYGYRVRGLEQVAEASEREALAALVGRGVLDAELAPADCFRPRHGLRAVREGHRLDILISFECRLLEVHLDGRKAASAATGDAHEPALSAAYRARGLELAD